MKTTVLQGFFTTVAVAALLVGGAAITSNLVAPVSVTAASSCTDLLGPWRTVAPLSQPLASAATASDGAYIYAAGGGIISGGYGPSYGSNQLSRYDPATNVWTSLAAAPTRFGLASAVYAPINKKLYVLGGIETDGTTNHVVATTRIYDPATNAWSTGAAMPDIRILVGVGYWNGKIYATGGARSTLDTTLFNQTWVYDIAANTWTALALHPSSGSFFGYGLINGHLYITGGYDPVNNIYVTSTYDYDIAANKWTARASLPQAIDTPGSAVVGSHLYILGGYFGTGRLDEDTTYVYDPASDSWSNGPNLNQRRSSPGGAVIGNDIYAVGGYAAGTTLSSVEVATVSCQAATPTPALTSTPVATPAPTPPPQTASTDNPYKFAATGKTIGGKFRAYWESHGGLAQQGYPITDEFQEVSLLDGKTYTVQYFERAVFELHPENAGTPYEVELSQLGTFRYKQKYPSGAPAQAASTDHPYIFPQTGHTIGGKFRAYWESHGGLAQQGYPISDEFQEVSALDGKTYTVQYFERAVFELHRENAGTPYEVELSQLGTFQYQQKYQAAP